MKFSIWFLVALPFVLQNCISVSSYQSARTVRPGEWTGFGGLSSQSVTFTKDHEGTLDEEVEKINVPLIEGGARFGMTESLDLGFKYTTPGSLTGELKFMFSDPSNQKTAHAIGLGITHASFEYGSGNDEGKYSILDLTIPYFFTYDMSVENSIHLSPRYIMRSTSLTEIDGTEDKDTAGFIGMNIGFNFSGFVIEAGAFTASGDSEAFITQYTIGYSGAWEVVNRGPVSRPPVENVADDDEPAKEEKKKKKKKKKKTAEESD